MKSRVLADAFPHAEGVVFKPDGKNRRLAHTIARGVKRLIDDDMSMNLIMVGVPSLTVKCGTFELMLN